MSMKVTRNVIKEEYPVIIEVGYCGLQEVRYILRKVGHTEGIYGWNADIFEVSDTVAICTGYRPFGNVHPKPNEVKQLRKTISETVEKLNHRNPPLGVKRDYIREDIHLWLANAGIVF